MATATKRIPITGDLDADRLLVRDPLALLIGMLLDQQVPMEWAFRGPATLRDRLPATADGRLDAGAIAAMDRDAFVALCCTKPAIHRFPASMGRRIWDACAHVEEHYGGDASRIWKRVRTGAEVYRRLREIPGYGDEKARIFVAILGKRLGVRPAGWEEAADPFGDAQPRSVADVADELSLQAVRDWKKAMKAARKTKRDQP
ncbi:MAG: HhH-GPD-type base excision DNA repair protein [Microthrixaceae bacterium]